MVTERSDSAQDSLLIKGEEEPRLRVSRRNVWPLLLLSAIGGMLTLVPSAVAQTQGNYLPVDAPWTTVEVFVFDYEDTGIALPSDGALSPDGSLVVADFQSGELTKLDPSGRVTWSVGRKGEGPGEFRFLYKVFVDSAGATYAYDMGGSRVSVFTPQGEFVRRVQLDLPFRQVDDLQKLDGGEYLVAGVPSYPGLYLERSLHVFSDSGEYLTSFGPLPAADSAEVLNYWGVGATALDNNGRILFGRRIPYDFFRYSAEGDLLDTIDPQIALVGKPDDAYVIERTEGKFRISFSDSRVDRPLPPYMIWGGRVLSGRILPEGRYWDIISSDGTLESSFRVPDNWGGVVAVDTSSASVWLVQQSDYATGILRVVIQPQYQPEERK